MTSEQTAHRNRGEQAEAFVKTLAMFAGLIKFDLTDEICMFYVQSLSPYGLEKSRQALMRLARSAKIGRGLPSVEEVLEIVAPHEVAKLDPEEAAAVIAGRIEQALVRWGSKDEANGYPEQAQYIGDLGWSIISGRWKHICESTVTRDLPTLKAQWRGELKGAISRGKSGLSEAPSLTEAGVRKPLDTMTKSLAIAAKGVSSVGQGNEPW